MIKNQVLAVPISLISVNAKLGENFVINKTAVVSATGCNAVGNPTKTLTLGKTFVDFAQL